MQHGCRAKPLLGKLFKKLTLQPFHEICDPEHDGTSVWSEEKSL